MSGGYVVGSPVDVIGLNPWIQGIEGYLPSGYEVPTYSGYVVGT